MRSRRPPITPATVADPDRLGAVLDALVLGDPELRRLHRQAVRRVRCLRGGLDGEQRHRFMELEETLNDRWARSLAVVATVFFQAGVRQARRRGGRR